MTWVEKNMERLEMGSQEMTEMQHVHLGPVIRLETRLHVMITSLFMIITVTISGLLVGGVSPILQNILGH